MSCYTVYDGHASTDAASQLHDTMVYTQLPAQPDEALKEALLTESGCSSGDTRTTGTKTR